MHAYEGFTHTKHILIHHALLLRPSRRESLGSTGAHSVAGHGPAETAGWGWAKNA